ncbi:MAG: archease [Candidatus Pacearchaeota archaeon]
MSYKFLEHTADALFEVNAKNIEKIFIDAAKALTEIQVNIKKVKRKEKYEINIKDKDIEQLLFNWLSELIFVKDTKQLIFSKFDVKIEKNDYYILKAICYGEKINPKQEPKADAKAITMHEFKLWKENSIWKARVLVDI